MSPSEKTPDSTLPLDFNRRDFLRGGSLATLMMLMGGAEITAQTTDKTLPPPKADPNFKEKPPAPPVNFGVIGAGAWGREILSTLARQSNAPVAAVCDNYASSLRRAAELAPKAEKYADYHQLLDSKDVQAVVVSTPSHEHKEIALAALQAGKHVCCEAPLASTIEDARVIARAAKAAGKQIFQTGLNYRANPQHHHVLQFIRTGAMGKPVFARAQWHNKLSWRKASPNPAREKALNWRLDPEMSSGLMGEIGIHQVDVASWFFAGLPHSVTGFGGIIAWNDGRAVPDTIQAVFEYADGVKFAYDATLANSFDSTFDMFYGTDSAIIVRVNRAWMFKEADSPLLGWEVYARKDEILGETGIALVANATKLLALGKKPAEAAADSDTPLYYAFEEFIRNIDEKKAPSAGYREGFESVVTAVKANESILSGQKIIYQKEWFEVG